MLCEHNQNISELSCTEGRKNIRAVLAWLIRLVWILHAVSKDQQTNCVLLSSTGGQLILLRVEKISELRWTYQSCLVHVVLDLAFLSLMLTSTSCIVGFLQSTFGSQCSSWPCLVILWTFVPFKRILVSSLWKMSLRWS